MEIERFIRSEPLILPSLFASYSLNCQTTPELGLGLPFIALPAPAGPSSSSFCPGLASSSPAGRLQTTRPDFASIA